MDALGHWKCLKKKLTDEGGQLVGVTHQLKMKAAGGKLYKTDVAETGSQRIEREGDGNAAATGEEETVTPA
jgi:GMP synthase-like glutamine amidotransferase